MDRQQMIDIIYEKIADKTLNEWCKLLVNDWSWFYEKIISWPDDNINSCIDVKVLWHRVSLARVLSALGKWFQYYYWCIMETWTESWVCFKRKLLTDSWSDAYLEDQSDDTVKAIHDLLLDK